MSLELWFCPTEPEFQESQEEPPMSVFKESLFVPRTVVLALAVGLLALSGCATTADRGNTDGSPANSGD
jgi:hypothetical protein